jgi:hypothetical protein
MCNPREWRALKKEVDDRFPPSAVVLHKHVLVLLAALFARTVSMEVSPAPAPAPTTF